MINLKKTGTLSKAKKRAKRARIVRLSVAFLIAAIFAVLFLTPIVLTITNSFMSETEINANYGQIFAKNARNERNKPKRNQKSLRF